MNVSLGQMTYGISVKENGFTEIQAEVRTPREEESNSLRSVLTALSAVLVPKVSVILFPTIPCRSGRNMIQSKDFIFL